MHCEVGLHLPQPWCKFLCSVAGGGTSWQVEFPCPMVLITIITTINIPTFTITTLILRFMGQRPCRAPHSLPPEPEPS